MLCYKINFLEIVDLTIDWTRFLKTSRNMLEI